MAVAIPKVQVPMNFGVQYLGSPLHSNLRFRAKDDEELLANSMIISFNSPVIEDLVTNLFQSVIEVEEYSKDVVQCFMEAAYSGEVKNISRANFRDINKMGHVFDVSWIVDRCYDHFKSLLEAVKVDDYDLQVFLFEEAMFVFTRLKRRNLLDLVANSFTSIACCTKNFVTKYLNDLSICSAVSLDAIIEMVDEKEDILINVLINHLGKKDCHIDDNTRYLLKQLTFQLSEPSQAFLYQNLIEKLECIDNPTIDDFTIIAGLLKRCNQALFSEKIVAKSQVCLPNLFQSFHAIKDITNLTNLATFLKESKAASNLYMYYDAISSWLFHHGSDKTFSFLDVPDSFVEEIHGVTISRNWRPLPGEYVSAKHNDCREFGNLAPKILNNVNIITDTQYNRIISIREYLPEHFFGRNHDVKFKFRHESRTNCQKEGDCGFILRVKAATGKHDDAFNIQLLIDNKLYPKDIHFHRRLTSLIENSHFAFDVTNEKASWNHYKDLPVTWYDKPCLDGSKKFWSWGAYRFYDKVQATECSETNYEWVWYLGACSKIRPVMYYFP